MPVIPDEARIPCSVPVYDAKTNADLVVYVTSMQSEIMICDTRRAAAIWAAEGAMR